MRKKKKNLITQIFSNKLASLGLVRTIKIIPSACSAQRVTPLNSFLTFNLISPEYDNIKGP